MTDIRMAGLDDLEAIERVRALVRENRLVTPIPRERVVEALQARGRGWVAEHDGEIVGFSMADLVESSIWALFLLPEWEGKGLGRALLDRAVAWLFDQGCTSIWLTTDPATRAAGFYEHVGWKRVGPAPNGEVRFELTGERRDDG
jgi:GNAT superfamily N-acetyltransferase